MKYSLLLLFGLTGCDHSSENTSRNPVSLERLNLLLRAAHQKHPAVFADAYHPPLQERVNQTVYTSEMWLRETLDYSAERLWGFFPWD